MNFVVAFTAAGPILGGLSWLLHWPWLFWVGVALCTVSLLMDISSGAMKLPVIPGALMALGSGAMSPWWFGAAVGLMTWTAFESVGSLVTQRKLSRRPPDL